MRNKAYHFFFAKNPKLASPADYQAEYILPAREPSVSKIT